jgi:hypothetical protein
VSVSDAVIKVIETINVGVLLMHSGENSEESMYRNESSGSVEYLAFLQLLGHNCKSRSLNFVKADGFTFHVSTMIELPVWDKTCIERKRYVGNDQILILFKEHHEASANLETITSSQNMVIFIVMKSPVRLGYTVKVYAKDMVPAFSYCDYIASQDDLYLSRTHHYTSY